MRFAIQSKLFAALAAAAIALAAAGWAAKAEAASCSVNVSDMNFGSVDTLSGIGGEATAEISVTCDQVSGSKVSVCVNLGAGSGGSVSGMRYLQEGTGGALSFQLFSDSGYASRWGAYDEPSLGGPRKLVLTADDGGASAVLPLYGRVPSSQSQVSPGTYSSTFSANHAALFYSEGEGLDCSAPGGASLSQASFSVTGNVSANCLVDSEDIDFGSRGLLDEPVTASGAVLITCTPGTGYTVSLDGGQSGATNPEQRWLRAGAKSIFYGLYSDAAHSLPWGSTAGTILSGIGAGGQQVVPIYGRVLPQPSGPGDYSDRVVLTIAY